MSMSEPWNRSCCRSIDSSFSLAAHACVHDWSRRHGQLRGRMVHSSHLTRRCERSKRSGHDNMTRFADRVAIVTGAAQGMGFAIAARLLREGARVVLGGGNADGLYAAVDTLTDGRNHAQAVHCDVTSASAVRTMVASATE